MTSTPLTLSDALEANLRLWEAVCAGRQIPKAVKLAYSVEQCTRNRLRSLLDMPRLAPFNPKIPPAQVRQAHAPWHTHAKADAAQE